VEKLADQTLLAKIAVDDKDQDIRKAAVEKLTDQPLLAKIAIDDKDQDIRKAAVRKLTDQVALAKVVTDERDQDIRYAAAGRITDADFLERIPHIPDFPWLSTIIELRRLLAKSTVLPDKVWISLSFDVRYGRYIGDARTVDVGYEAVYI
jgi:hypothetical protein